MNVPVFLSVAQVQRLHQVALERFGGMEGVREQGLLESAVMQPQHVFYYAQGDLFQIASAYAYHLAENQPFIDGNKRTAAGAVIVFLRLNNVDTDFDSMKLHAAMISIAEKQMNKEELADLLRQITSE